MAEKNYHISRFSVLNRYARLLGYGDIYTKIHKPTGLHAIIAVHNVKRGPGLGGCRLFEYDSIDKAFQDALSLGYLMTLKSSFNDVPHGGAKAVLLKPKIIPNREDYFRAFGDFIHELNGRYIAGVDVGTATEDMDIIAERTPFVIGAAKVHQHERDPSPSTALGILRGMEAAVQFKLKRKDFSGLRVAIQGAGHVGYHLAKLLTAKGASLTICDLNEGAAKRIADEFNAQVVNPEAIYQTDCDIFSPCAMGGIINHQTIAIIKAPIIAGSANSQLAHHLLGRVLHQKGILYAPDFVINAGGLISAAIDYTYRNTELADNKINQMYDNMLHLFERSTYEGLPTTQMAEKIAMEKLAKIK